MAKQLFTVDGMHCAACARSVEMRLRAMQGVTDVGVNLINHTAWVEFNPHLTSPDQLIQAVAQVGFTLTAATLHAAQKQQESQLHTQKWRLYGIIVLASITLILPHIFPFSPLMWSIEAILASIVVIVGGWSIHTRAIKQLRKGIFSMDTLIMLSTLTTLFYSMVQLIMHMSKGDTLVPLYFHSSAMIIAFVSVGKWLELRAKSWAHRDITSLIAMQPQWVMRVGGHDTVQRIPLQEVKHHDTLRVRQGERIPVDGEILSGKGYLDESNLSGESLPIWREAGQPVYAGTLCTEGSIDIKVLAVGEEALLGQIISHVESVQQSTPPAQQLADRIAGIFVPVVLGLALLTLFLWAWLAPTDGWQQGMLCAVAVLAAACPCALGLAIPTAIATATGRAARSGVIIREFDALQQCARIKHLLLDKTGTLTQGTFVVKEALWHPHIARKEQEKLRKILYSLESHSLHPLSAPIAQWCEVEQALTLDAIQETPGYGIEGRYEDETYAVVNWALYKKQYPENEALHAMLALPEAQAILQHHAASLSLLTRANTPCVLLAVEDRLRPEAVATIHALQQAQITPHLLSGDHEEPVRQAAQQMGITHWHAQMNPLQKEEYLRQLQEKGLHVAAVGDGVNDAPLLAQAHVGIAMASGADVTIGLADITLMKNQLQALPFTLQLGKFTLRIMKENLFWAFFYNMLMLPWAAGALYPLFHIRLDPMYAALAMALSSVSVVLNSLRIQRLKAHPLTTATPTTVS